MTSRINILTIQSGSEGNAYIVSDPQTTILLEAGLPYREIIKKYNNTGKPINAVLISHKHSDHCLGAKDFENRRIPIYTHDEVAEHKKLYLYNQIKSGETYTIDSFIVKPFELEHDVYNLGFLIYSKITKEKLLFITDTMYVKNKFKGINYLMIECNHSTDKLMSNKQYHSHLKKRIRQTHLNLDDVLYFLESNNFENLKEIYLIHRSKQNSDDKLILEKISEKTKAKAILC